MLSVLLTGEMNMSFVDSIKYIRQLSVVDEFGGLGDASKISRFYVVFRATDSDGEDIEVSETDVVEAIRDKNIEITDWVGLSSYSLAPEAANADGDHFVFGGFQHRNNVNIFEINLAEEFRDDVSFCVRFMDGDTELMSSCYMSSYPSAIFTSK
jgi:hypothetical protein